MGLERELARLAAGAEGRIDPAALMTPIDDGRRLVDLLAPDERPHHLLEGILMDVVRRGDDGTDEERARKMATTDGGVYALVTDRGVRLVVSYGASATTYHVGFEELRDVSMRTLGGDRRLRLVLEDVTYDLYPTTGGEACEAAVAFLTTRVSDPPENDGKRDPLAILERLADLRDHGAITEAEFEAKKRELLEEI